MPRFHYEAKQSPTQTVQGVVVAENMKFAIQQISWLGLYAVSVKEENAPEATSGAVKSGLVFFRRGIGLRDTTEFSRQLADLLESGIPIIRSLEFLEAQMPHKKMKDAIHDIKEQCVAGASLSGAMAGHPEIFSRLDIALTRAGETAGTLDSSLQRLATFGDKQLEIRARVRSAMAYPVLMAGVGTLTVIVLLTFVIPRMQGIFSDLGKSLPLPTQILLFMSALLTRYFVLVAIAAAASVGALWNFYKTRAGRKWFDQLKLNLPVFGPLFKKIEIARFAQTLSTLLENGIPILEGLRISARAVENSLMREEIEACWTVVKGGGRLSAGFSNSRLFPPMLVQIIGVGEESGHLEKTLKKLAETYERESDSAVKVMMSLLEPAMILTLGVIVGFMVIAILLPVFEISLSAK